MFQDICLDFEKKYNMDSDQFINNFDKALVASISDAYEWYAAKAGYDIWQMRLKQEIFKTRYRLDMFNDICKNFEKKYDMDSEKFLIDFEKGKFQTKAEYFEWYASKIAVDQMKHFLQRIDN